MSEVHYKLSRVHDQRLRAMYRSGGWPCLDAIEIDLLAAGLLERITPASRAEHLRVTDAGLQRLSQVLHRNRGALNAHETLVRRVAEEQVRHGRITYCGLTLRAKPGDDWLHLRPDVFSIRHTTVEDYIEPVVYEVKVKRSDLKADLSKPEKRAGYIALSSECYYVLAEGVGTAVDVPPECGVILATATRLETLRVAPKRPMRLGFDAVMSLLKAERFRPLLEVDPQL